MSTNAGSGGPSNVILLRGSFTDRSEHLPDPALIGMKARNLMRLARIGLNVPPGFVLSTQLCRDYLAHDERALDGIEERLAEGIGWLEHATHCRFGDARRPLLVSVRSGAAVSMPGMLETILNVGLNETSAHGLARMTGNPRLAPDCQRRLIEQFGAVVANVPPQAFESRCAEILEDIGQGTIAALDSSGLTRLAVAYRDVYRTATGKPFPSDPMAQLRAAVAAVLRSWSNERARAYRRLHGIPDDLGTAVLVQAMVFGNGGLTSGSGVGFTRNPSNGADELYLDFLSNAQGEDVVSGRRRALGAKDLKARVPAAYEELLQARGALEKEFGDMQDFEFTIEDGRLYFLQSRTGKRTPLAALEIAHALVAQGRITPWQALSRLRGLRLDEIEIVALDPAPGQVPLFRGIPASSGVAVGAIAFDADRILSGKQGSAPVILVRSTAETNNVDALSRAAALVTAQGARTSHAAVVARQMGKPCIVGCEGLAFDPSGGSMSVNGSTLLEGEIVSLDGTTGDIYRGEVPIMRRRPDGLLEEIRTWVERGRNEE